MIGELTWSSAFCIVSSFFWPFDKRTAHFFCVTFRVKLESPKYDLQNFPVDDGLGFEDQRNMLLNPGSLGKFAHESRKVQSFFKGNSRGHSVYSMLNFGF